MVIYIHMYVRAPEILECPRFGQDHVHTLVTWRHIGYPRHVGTTKQDDSEDLVKFPCASNEEIGPKWRFPKCAWVLPYDFGGRKRTITIWSVWIEDSIAGQDWPQQYLWWKSLFAFVFLEDMICLFWWLFSFGVHVASLCGASKATNQRTCEQPVHSQAKI